MRINSHQVIQMVGDDSLVFVEDWSGNEQVLSIAEAARRLETIWKPAAQDGRIFGLEGVTFVARDIDNVTKAIEYFVECSQMSVDDQLDQMTVTELDPKRDIGDQLKELGLLD